MSHQSEFDTLITMHTNSWIQGVPQEVGISLYGTLCTQTIYYQSFISPTDAQLNSLETISLLRRACCRVTQLLHQPLLIYKIYKIYKLNR